MSRSYIGKIREGGYNELKHYPVAVCNSNEIYAEEAQKALIESGYQNVLIPKDFGLTYSAVSIGYEDSLGARCGNLDAEIRSLPSERKGKVICTSGAPMRKAPVCMPDGTLGLCCNDYALDTRIGNIIDDDWGTIALGIGYQEYLNALENDDKRYMCRYCGAAQSKSAAISSVYPDYFTYGDNYYQVKGVIEKGEHALAKKLQRAEHICVFGIGKFFKDNYFQAGWNSIIQAYLLSDNNESLWGRNFGGIPVIPKQQLLSYQNLLVVVYTMNPNVIIDDLCSMGIQNIIQISDVMEIFGRN